MSTRTQITLTPLILSGVCFVVAQFVDVRRPINVAVRRGQPVEFNCQSDSIGSIHTWKFKAVESNQDKVIYSHQVGLNNVTSLEVRRGCDNRTCDLVTTATQLTDAGRYTCVVMVPVKGSDGLELVQRAAQLIVLDVEPNCRTNAGESVLEGQMLEMRCSIGFRGNWAPKMKWRQDGDGEVMNDGVDTVTVPNSTVTSTLRAVDWTKSYTCTIYFDQPDGEIDNSLATNAPEYNYTWMLPVINIKARHEQLMTGEAGGQLQVIPLWIGAAAAALILVLMLIVVVLSNVTCRALRSRISTAMATNITSRNKQLTVWFDTENGEGQVGCSRNRMESPLYEEMLRIGTQPAPIYDRLNPGN